MPEAGGRFPTPSRPRPLAGDFKKPTTHAQPINRICGIDRGCKNEIGMCYIIMKESGFRIFKSQGFWKSLGFYWESLSPDISALAPMLCVGAESTTAQPLSGFATLVGG